MRAHGERGARCRKVLAVGMTAGSIHAAEARRRILAAPWRAPDFTYREAVFMGGPSPAQPFSAREQRRGVLLDKG